MDRGTWQATVRGGHKKLYTTEPLTLSLPGAKHHAKPWDEEK